MCHALGVHLSISLVCSFVHADGQRRVGLNLKVVCRRIVSAYCTSPTSKCVTTDSADLACVPPFSYLYLFMSSDCNHNNTKKTNLTMEVVCGRFISVNRAWPTSKCVTTGRTGVPL